jgi:hypothetical protein
MANMSTAQVAKDRKENPVPCGDITHSRCRRILASLLTAAGSDLYVVCHVLLGHVWLVVHVMFMSCHVMSMFYVQVNGRAAESVVHVLPP